MKTKTSSLIKASVLGAALTVSSQAAVLTFDTGGTNNEHLAAAFGSNLAAATAGANISNGATPDIELAWAPTVQLPGTNNDTWETHGANNSFWDTLDPTSSAAVDVVQLDNRGGGADPSVTFTVTDGLGLKLQLNSLMIGHASDQTESPFGWTITIAEVGGATVLTYNTALLDASDTETVNFNFTGTTDTDYVLTFDDGGASSVQTRRGAIDNLSFNQVPEPSSVTLIGLGGLALILRRRK